VTIGIDTVVYYQVTDAVKATYEVLNVLVAIEQLTITTLRNVVGSMTLEERSPAATRSTPSCARCSTTPPRSGGCG